MSETLLEPSTPPTQAPVKRRKWLRRLGVGFLIASGVLVAALSVLLAMAWEAMGTGPEGARLERIQGSAQWSGDRFENPRPLNSDFWGSFVAMFGGSDYASPSAPLPVVDVDPRMFETPPNSGLRVTWLGHSTLIIEIDGVRLLTDPVWGPRSSPLSFIGPERWYAPRITLDALPSFDAVVISHDHYDHLDHSTIVAMKDWQTTFIVPLGVGAHLEYWGVPVERIVEMDWWEEVDVAGIKVACTPARHASGRHLFDRDRTLWASYAFVGATNRVYFSGDTGMFPEFSEIGAKYGPFDVTMIEVGAYHRTWPDWHMGPEQALQAHALLRGEVFIPIHWGLFDLAMHGWTEPVERTLIAAKRAGVRAAIPRPGESVEPVNATAASERWWPDVPWETATEHPIEATNLGSAAVP